MTALCVQDKVVVVGRLTFREAGLRRVKAASITSHAPSPTCCLLCGGYNKE